MDLRFVDNLLQKSPIGKKKKKFIAAFSTVILKSVFRHLHRGFVKLANSRDDASSIVNGLLYINPLGLFGLDLFIVVRLAGEKVNYPVLVHLNRKFLIAK